MPRIRVRFRTRLERERTAAHLTQTELARLARISQGTVSRLEHQRFLRPGIDVLASLAWALNRRGRKVHAEDLTPSKPVGLVTTAADRKRRKSA